MLAVIESTNDIRNTLGDTYSFIKSFDILARERSKTKYFRKQLMRKYSKLCASCGQSDGYHRLKAAHILALEEGGKTENENLVLLCHDCHTLYDCGYASLKEMEEAVASWRNGEHTNLRARMTQRRDSFKSHQPIVRPLLEGYGAPGNSLYDVIQARKYAKALHALEEAKSAYASLEARQVLAIVEAQIQRRRSARGSLEIANRLLEKVEIDKLPDERMPLYYYERGYTKQLMGLTAEASGFFLKSFEHASVLRDRYAALEGLIARSQYLATKVILLPREPTPTRDTIASICKQYDMAARQTAELEPPFGGRWELNCRIWRVNLLLKSGNHKMALKSFQKVRELRNRQNVMSGWTIAARITITGLHGLILIQTCSSLKHMEGLRLLARALVPLLGGHRQRPEGIRDWLLGIEKGLSSFPRRWRGSENHLKKIKTTRAKVMDGSSFLDPYQSSLVMPESAD